MRIEFDHARGLKSRDGGPLKRFEIAGEDQKWFWADAEIDGETVVVSSKDVPKPVAVRYAWASNPDGRQPRERRGPAGLVVPDRRLEAVDREVAAGTRQEGQGGELADEHGQGGEEAEPDRGEEVGEHQDAEAGDDDGGGDPDGAADGGVGAADALARVAGGLELGPEADACTGWWRRCRRRSRWRRS